MLAVAWELAVHPVRAVKEPTNARAVCPWKTTARQSRKTAVLAKVLQAAPRSYHVSGILSRTRADSHSSVLLSFSLCRRLSLFCAVFTHTHTHTSIVVFSRIALFSYVFHNSLLSRTHLNVWYGFTSSSATASADYQVF